MIQALPLGFKSFIHFPRSFRFPVSPRICGVGTTVVSFGVRTMAPKRPSSNASVSASSVAHEKKEKRLKGSVGASLDSETQDLKDETVKVDKMTVQELRTALRGAGLSAKGSKRDLVSALKSYLDKKTDGEILETEQPSSLSVDSLSAVKTTKLSDGEHSVDMTTVCEASTFRQTKSIENVVANIENVDVGIVRETTRVRKHGISARKQASTEASVASVVDKAADDNRLDIPANENEPWTIFAHKKPQKGWVAYNPKTMRPSPLTADTKSLSLMSWNVNGLRALLKLEGFSALQLAKKENFDVLCLQETKVQEKDIQSVADSLMLEYPNCYWACSISKLGYSGTAIISRIKPLSVRYGLGIEYHDSEGRIITAEFDTFFLISAYVPNSGDGLRRLAYRTSEWDTSLSNHLKELEKSKPVILTGDLNCAHQEIDIFNPAGNKRSAGFTIEERQSFETNFLSKGFVDTFRKQHPGAIGYTYWGYRHGARKTNKGWRLDYFLVSESMAEKVHDSYILPEVMGSDHCPIGLVLKL